MKGVFGGGVSGGTPTSSTWEEMGTSFRGKPTATLNQSMKVILTYNVWVHRVPIVGLRGSGEDAYQYPDSIS